MRIFVTGATGFLGRSLVPALEMNGHQVTGVSSLQCNLLRSDGLCRFDERYDQIWHLAAWTQAGDFCLRHPGDQWIINQLINVNLLDWWRSKQPQAKLIAMGTSCSYAPDSDLVEENYLAGTPVPELYSYAMTKRMLLIGLQALNAQFGLQYLYLVPSTLYGPGYHTDGRQRHFIFDLIEKIIRGARKNEKVELWGDGHQKREIVCVDDFIRAAVQLSDRVRNEVVNIGSGVEYSIRWYADFISRIVGYDPVKIMYDTSRYVGVRSKQLCTHKLKALLPEFEMMPTETALKQTTLWYYDQLSSPTPSVVTCR